jgi:hypothetical protein
MENPVEVVERGGKSKPSKLKEIQNQIAGFAATELATKQAKAHEAWWWQAESKR